MKIAVAADHGGFSLKELIKKHLREKGVEVKDYGAHQLDKADDYPDFSFPAAKSVAEGQNEKGIFVCTTGIGMSISANKVKGVRAALVMTPELAFVAGSHNHANVITLPGNGQISAETALEIVDTYLGTTCEGGRHQRRVQKIGKRAFRSGETSEEA